MKEILLYVENLKWINGIYTWLLSFYNAFKDDYEITVMTDADSRRFMYQFDDFQFYEKTATYVTDIFINSYAWKPAPKNVKCKQSYTILHCDYGGIEYKVPPVFSADEHYIAVSRYAAENFTKKFGLPCDYVEGLLVPVPKIQRRPHQGLRLISCTRMQPKKGSERMKQLCRLLQDAGVEFAWDNYCEQSDNHCNAIKWHTSIPQEELYQQIADADYLIQLSESEGYCRAVHEALMVGTPVIVCDIPIFHDVVKNGVNGYKIPLDVKNTVNLDQIIQNIPKGFQIKSMFEDTKKAWESMFKNTKG